MSKDSETPWQMYAAIIPQVCPTKRPTSFTFMTEHGQDKKDANIVKTSRNGMLWEVILRPSLRQCPQWMGSMCAQEHMEFWPRSDPESSCLPSADV